MNIFEIESFDIKNKKRNLDARSSGVVSSTKYFPVFEVYGKEKIFKPLSKTKPLSTPLFSYSEVYWSYLINKYIDKRTPVYKLAYCKGLSQEDPKYYEKGCIVDNILNKGESLINILELYKKYPDTLVDIDSYTNYCEVQYDYEPILKSAFFTEKQDLAKKLCEQILCSVLRRDDNYHYENISLIEKAGQIQSVAPIIDLEFSEMFMYPDNNELHKRRFSLYDEGMSPLFKYDDSISYEENYCLFKKKIEEGSIYDECDRYHFGNLLRNLKTIVELHPDTVKEFLEKIKLMRKEVEELNINFDNDFLGRFSSDDYKPSSMLIKEGKTEDDSEYLEAEKEVDEKRITLSQEEFNNNLKREVLWSIDKLSYILKSLLSFYERKIVDIKSYNNKTLYESVDRLPEQLLELIVEGRKHSVLVKEDKYL